MVSEAYTTGDAFSSINSGYPDPTRTFTPLSAPLLHSSFIPAPEDESTIRETIKEVHRTLTSVDDEIHRLRSGLAGLEEYRSHLHTTLKHRQAVISPIRRLPPEILGEIFLFAAEGCSMIWPRRHLNADDDAMPWLLGKICSYWRTVALSLPKLWSEIHLDLNFCVADRELDDQSEKANAAQEFLQACLVRSGNEILTFTVDAKGLRSAIKPILSSLVTHSDRWKEASLDIDLFSAYHADLAPAKNRVNNLRKLHIGTSAMEDIPSFTPLDAFEDTPKLREVSITGIVQPFHVLRIPWSQVTRLTSKGSTFREGEFTQIMRHTTNLVSFSTEGERILEVASSQPVLLSHLQKLDVINKGSYISKTFQFLTAPNLQELSIHAITPFVADQTVAMLTRSQCKPTHLTFRSSLDVDALWEENLGIVWMLRELSSVAHLRLTVLRSADNIIPRLVNRHQAAGLPPLLPNLQTFALEDRFCLSAAEVTDALSLRIKGLYTDAGFYGAFTDDQPAGLRSINLQLSRPAAPKFPELDLLKKVAENHGVEITIQLG
ncbi:hypothetical protein BDZ97DRAFT_2058033 [Flammula alnicola]|nr:hypothetical protein BDZ97DRAFT_2058033 [Flammula alnicola]